MGLISKIAIVKWHPKNKYWYVNRGYVFTKFKDEFEVNIEDLTKASKAMVKVKCDCQTCTTPITKLIRWVDYLKSVKEDGKYYCQKCVKTIVCKEKTLKTKLKNSKSFEQWCIENNRQDVLDRWDYELNDCKPSEILFSSRKEYYFKCENKLHFSELKHIDSLTGNQQYNINCKQCNSFAQWSIDNIGDDFLEKYWDYEKNTVDPWEIARGCKKKVWIKCQEKNYHGSYDINCVEFINGCRCNYCNTNGKKVHPLDSLGQYIINNYNEDFLKSIWSDKNKKSPFNYAPNSNKKVYWECPESKHKRYYRSILSSNSYKFRCPECSKERKESLLQEKVRLYLTDLKYVLLHERNCNIIAPNINSTFKNKKGLMPYDNEISNLNLIIEVNGMQHYRITNYTIMSAEKKNITPEEEFNYQQLKDKYKRDYALSKGYFYLEIPYWTDDKEKTWKKLIDDKINEIININIINNLAGEKEVS